MKRSHKLLEAICRPVALSFILVAVGLGCARTKLLEIITKPSQATIYVDGEEKGLSPSSIRFNFTSNEEQRVLLQLVKDGYQPVFQYYEFVEVPHERKSWTLDSD